MESELGRRKLGLVWLSKGGRRESKRDHLRNHKKKNKKMSKRNKTMIWNRKKTLMKKRDKKEKCLIIARRNSMKASSCTMICWIMHPDYSNLKEE